ncbi:MAG: hypothetical protein J6R89_01825 [Clostridia bacterium]|nr:hypothetical protein [Clostridia bacterium]
MAYLMYNEDCTHFIYTRSSGGADPVTMAHVDEFIAKHVNTGVTDFFVNVGSAVPFYPSKRFDGIYKYAFKDSLPDHSRYLKGCLGFYEREGISLPEAMLRCLKKTAVRPWISLRMNDVHECYFPESALWSDFFRTHRGEWNLVPHRKRTKYHEYELNYLVPEVYAFYLTLVEDALDNFDSYGIELDFMREAYCIGVGREAEGVAVMNRFMREVKALVKKAEERYGHPIKIGVRLPSLPDKALRLGFDACLWAEEGLIDLLVATSRWHTSYNDIPLDLWRRLLRGTNVILAAGLERCLNAYPGTGSPHTFQSYASAVGAACANLSEGADAIYLYNFFDGYNGHYETPDFFCNDDALRARFLALGGDYEQLQREPRRHVVTYDDTAVPTMTEKAPLPLTLSADRGASTPLESAACYGRLRVPTGKIGKDKTVTLLLGFESEEGFALSDLEVYVNQRPCAPLGKQAPDTLLRPRAGHTYAFSVENDGSLPTVSVIEVGLTHGSASVVWAEIDVV